MSRVILLDAGPLGLVTNPKRSPMSTAAAMWLQQQVSGGTSILVPEIADYEVRRELLRAGKNEGLARLDTLIQVLDYLPISTAAMRNAAAFWAQARRQGQPTAADDAIDIDMILAGQAVSLGSSDVVIATTNVGHLGRFVAADLWQNLV